MFILTYILVFTLLAGITIYTASFGIWTWKEKNRLGAVMVFAVAAANVALPLYSLFFRD